MTEIDYFERFPLVPRRFCLFGHEYTVRFVPNIRREHGAVGRCDAQQNTIDLDPDQAESCIEQTFWHEVIHVIFFCLGIKHNDQRVEQIAQCLHQVLTTMSNDGVD